VLLVYFQMELGFNWRIGSTEEGGFQAKLCILINKFSPVCEFYWMQI